MKNAAEAKARQFLSESGFTVMHMCITKKLNYALKQQMVVAVTDQALVSFDLKVKKEPVVGSWLELTKVARDERTLTMEWGKVKVTLALKETELVEALVEACQRILTYNELVAVRFGKLEMAPVRAGPQGFIARANEWTRVNGKIISPKFRKMLRNRLRFSDRSIILSDLPYLKTTVHAFFAALPVYGKIADVAVTGTPDMSAYEILCNIPVVPERMNRLETAGDVTAKIQAFVGKWKGTGKTQIKCLAFRDSNFGKEELSAVADLAKATGTNGLEFHNAVQSQAVPVLYSLLDARGLRGVISLNFSGTKDLDLGQLFPHVGSLVLLSLANCGVDINNVFESLMGHSRLRVLDLSDNACSGVVKNIPASLHTLFVRNVRWGNGTFNKFVALACSQRLRLDISEARANSADWSKIGTGFKTSSTSRLVALNWSGNEVSDKFFSLLRANQDLESLSLCECFGGDSAKITQELCKYVRMNRKLKRLAMRGSPSCCVGEGIVPIIEAAGKSSIEVLDIECSGGGDAGIAAIRVLLFDTDNAALKAISFDGLFPSNGDRLIGLLRQVASLKGIYIVFPSKDLKALVEKKFSQQSVVKDVKSMLRPTKEDAFRRNPPLKEEVFPPYVSDKLLAVIAKSAGEGGAAQREFEWESESSESALRPIEAVHGRKQAAKITKSLKEMKLAGTAMLMSQGFNGVERHMGQQNGNPRNGPKSSPEASSKSRKDVKSPRAKAGAAKTDGQNGVMKAQDAVEQVFSSRADRQASQTPSNSKMSPAKRPKTGVVQQTEVVAPDNTKDDHQRSRSNVKIPPTKNVRSSSEKPKNGRKVAPKELDIDDEYSPTRKPAKRNVQSRAHTPVQKVTVDSDSDDHERVTKSVRKARTPTHQIPMNESDSDDLVIPKRSLRRSAQARIQTPVHKQTTDSDSDDQIVAKKPLRKTLKPRAKTPVHKPAVGLDNDDQVAPKNLAPKVIRLRAKTPVHKPATDSDDDINVSGNASGSTRRATKKRRPVMQSDSEDDTPRKTRNRPLKSAMKSPRNGAVPRTQVARSPSPATTKGSPPLDNTSKGAITWKGDDAFAKAPTRSPRKAKKPRSSVDWTFPIHPALTFDDDRTRTIERKYTAEDMIRDAVWPSPGKSPKCI